MIQEYTNRGGEGEMGDHEGDIIVRMDDWKDTEIVVYLCLINFKDSNL